MSIKKLIILIIFASIPFHSVLGQCCPYIGELEIIPENPNSADSIYIVTRVTTPNVGEYLGYQLSNSLNLITIEACYYVDILTSPQSFIDTIYLGVHSEGILNVNFIAYQTSTLSGCSEPMTVTDTSSVLVEIEVESPTSFAYVPENAIKVDCFPNPIVHETFSISSNGFIQHLEIYNSKGDKVYAEDFFDQKLIEVNAPQLNTGVYFLKVKTRNNREIIKKILKL